VSDLQRGWPGTSAAAVGVRDQHRAARKRDRLEAGALAAVRDIDRHADTVHLVHHLGAEVGEAAIPGDVAAAAEPVAPVVGQLRHALAELVEALDVGERAEVIGVLVADDDADAAARAGREQVLGGRDALEIAGAVDEQSIPARRPAQRRRVRIARVGVDGRMADADAGRLEPPVVGFGEARRLVLPAGELLPVERQQTEHVDDRGAEHGIDRARRHRDRRSAEPAAAEVEHGRGERRGDAEQTAAQQPPPAPAGAAPGRRRRGQHDAARHRRGAQPAAVSPAGASTRRARTTKRYGASPT
jgi:hypothetical protein